LLVQSLDLCAGFLPVLVECREPAFFLGNPCDELISLRIHKASPKDLDSISPRSRGQ
jgi:hypothetical protein